MHRRGNPAFLGEHFASKDPAHISRWLAAMAAGRARRRCIDREVDRRAMPPSQPEV
jgi:hypothetical protein